MFVSNFINPLNTFHNMHGISLHVSGKQNAFLLDKFFLNSIVEDNLSLSKLFSLNIIFLLLLPS